MTAVVLTGHGDFDRLEAFHDWPTPGAGRSVDPGAACGLNNTDVNTRTAWYSKGVEENTTGGAFDSADEDDATWGGAPLTFPRVQGADVCGEVVAVGEGADAALIGKQAMLETWIRDWDDPMNLDAIGYFGWSAMVVLRTTPRSISATSTPSTATCRIRKSPALRRLLHGGKHAQPRQRRQRRYGARPGASGGVGGALIQLAKRRGAQVVALCSESKRERGRLRPRTPSCRASRRTCARRCARPSAATRSAWSPMSLVATCGPR